MLPELCILNSVFNYRQILVVLLYDLGELATQLVHMAHLLVEQLIFLFDALVRLGKALVFDRLLYLASQILFLVAR